MKVKFKKLSNKAATPKRIKSTDAGFVVSSTRRAIRPSYIEYGTDLSINIPKGYVGLLFPRSSVSNKNLSLANSVGVVDANFSGEITFRFRKSIGAAVHTNSEADMYKVGDIIGQLVIMELPKVELEEVELFNESTDLKTKSFSNTGE